MVSIIKSEFSKMKRYSVIWIGVATMFTVVLLARFMATASDGATHTLMNFSSSVIWNNLVLIYPATIALIAGYIIDRERTDDTLKNILTIPVSFRKMLIGKLIAVGCMAAALSVIEFLFTLIVFFASGFPGFSIGGMIQVLFQMIGINMISYCGHACYCLYCSKKRQLYGRCWLCFLLWFCGNDGLRPRPA